MNNKAFVLYTEYALKFQKLTNEQLGMLLRMIFEYESTGVITECEDMVVAVSFDVIKEDLDKQNKKYQAKVNAGKASADKRSSAKREIGTSEQTELNTSEQNPAKTNKSEQNTAKCTKEKEKEKEKEREKETDINIFFAPGDSHPMPLDPFEEFADVAAIPLNDGTEWRMPLETYKEFIKLYPNVDVKQQMNAMRGWVISNPTRRKTKTGVKRFINNWLSSEQNKPARTGGRSQSVPDYMLAQPVEQPAQTDITGISEVKDLLAQMGGKA